MNDTLVREFAGVAIATTAFAMEPMHIGTQATFFAMFGAVAGSFVRRRNNKKKYRLVADSGSFVFTALISFFIAVLLGEPVYIYLSENWLAEEYHIANIYNTIHLALGAMIYPLFEAVVVHLPAIYKNKILEKAKK